MHTEKFPPATRFEPAPWSAQVARRTLWPQRTYTLHAAFLSPECVEGRIRVRVVVLLEDPLSQDRGRLSAERLPEHVERHLRKLGEQDEELGQKRRQVADDVLLRPRVTLLVPGVAEPGAHGAVHVQDRMRSGPVVVAVGEVEVRVQDPRPVLDEHAEQGRSPGATL